MLRQINLAIIDDEVSVLNQLKTFISESGISEVCLKCVTTNVNELLNSLNDADIDAVLLDISMPRIDGFELADFLRRNYPAIKIIFMSAYEEFALKGYDFYPVDYLVKPINYLRLKQTLKMIIHQPRPKANSKIGLRSGGVLKLINVDQILYIEKRGRKTKIYLEDSQVIDCNESLSVLEQMLQSKGFYRTHQSYLVPLDKIEEISPDHYMKSYNIKLKNCGTTINVSRNKYKELKQELKNYLH
jgi:two-component system LytT family response regulator